MPAKRSIRRRTTSVQRRYSKPLRKSTTGSTASLPWPPEGVKRAGRSMRCTKYFDVNIVNIVSREGIPHGIPCFAHNRADAHKYREDGFPFGLSAITG